MKIYNMDNCPHCEKVNYELAEKFNIPVVNIHSKDYDGFVPDQVPAFQTPGLTLMGPAHINTVLTLMSHTYAQGCSCEKKDA